MSKKKEMNEKKHKKHFNFIVREVCWFHLEMMLFY